MKIDKWKNLICKTFPNLEIREFSLLGKGKSGTACLANNEIVFKIPQSSKGRIARWQKNESAVLNFLDGKLDIQIPKILYSATSENGLYIIGETLLSGVTYSYELHDSFDEATKANILRQLGKIIRNLHDVGGNDSSWQDSREHETYKTIIKNFDKRFSDDVKKVFSSEEIRKIEKIANDYKKITAEYPVKPVLCHFDFHFFNLMFDTAKKKISGLLDFGTAGYAEPARDMHYYFGDGARLILEGYGDNGDKYMKERQMFHSMSHLLDNLGGEIAKNQKPYRSLEFIKKYMLQK